jgi:hypothetical protein
MLAELKQKGETAIILGYAHAAKPGDFIGSMLTGRKYYRGTIKRIEAAAVPFSVLLDGKRTTVPTPHAKGVVAVGGESGELELWVLDQPELPRILRCRTWVFIPMSSRFPCRAGSAKIK